MRLVATPRVGALLSRLAPPSPKSVLRLASVMGERAITDLIQLARCENGCGCDPVSDSARPDLIPIG
jgi:hypothetical protein